MKKWLLGLFFIFILYMAFWPVPIEPVVWQPPIDNGYVGVFEKNTKLENFEALTMGSLSGPEAAIVLDSGGILATTHEGWLVRFVNEAMTAQPWVEVKGHPLGLDIDKSGNIWIANASQGLQKVTPQGEVINVLNKVEHTLIQYADDVVVAPNGKIYFTDATMRFPAGQWGGTLKSSVLDLLEHRKTGRVIEYDPNLEIAKIIFDGLTFANGITISENGEFLLVNETGEYRVWKYWLLGAKQGTSEIIIENLPGFPDNISLGLNDVYWLGLVAPRSSQADQAANKPYLRKILLRLPEFMHPKAEAYGMVIGINAEGEVLYNLQDPNGNLYTTTGVVETQESLYITSLTAPFLARVKKSDAGL